MHFCLMNSGLMHFCLMNSDLMHFCLMRSGLMRSGLMHSGLMNYNFYSCLFLLIFFATKIVCPEEKILCTYFFNFFLLFKSSYIILIRVERILSTTPY